MSTTLTEMNKTLNEFIFKFFMEDFYDYYILQEERFLNLSRTINKQIAEVVTDEKLKPIVVPVVKERINKFCNLFNTWCKEEGFKKEEQATKDFLKFMNKAVSEAYTRNVKARGKKDRILYTLLYKELHARVVKIHKDLIRNCISSMRIIYTDFIETNRELLYWLQDNSLVKLSREELKIMEEDDSVVVNHPNLYKSRELNKLATECGYELDRQKGDHSQYINKDTGKIVTIPQGRTIGKGLSIKIQKRLQTEALNLF